MKKLEKKIRKKRIFEVRQLLLVVRIAVEPPTSLNRIVDVGLDGYNGSGDFAVGFPGAGSLLGRIHQRADHVGQRAEGGRTGGHQRVPGRRCFVADDGVIGLEDRFVDRSAVLTLRVGNGQTVRLAFLSVVANDFLARERQTARLEKCYFN